MAIAGAPTWEAAASEWRARTRASSVGSVAALALIAGMLVCAVVIVLDAGSGRSPLVPPSPQVALLRGLGWHLGYATYVGLLVGMTGCYCALLAIPRLRIGTVPGVGAVVAMQLVVFAGPILISQDVFSYVAYARMGLAHGMDPYVQGPSAIAHDPIFQFVGSSWTGATTAYGPLFTLLSAPLGVLGLATSVWGMKLLALASSAGALALVWRCARLRGIDPARAVLFVGANPVVVIYALGGAHNDLLMNLLVMAGVTLALGQRQASSAIAVVGAALVKASAAVVLPFMLVAQRARRTLLGAAGALVVVLAISYFVFGWGAVNELALAGKDQGYVSATSFSNEIAHLFGNRGVYPVDHLIVDGAVLLGIGYLLWRTYRGYDWISAAGWALLLVAVTTTWLLPWYTIWAIPLAAIARDRRLIASIIVVQLLMGASGMASASGQGIPGTSGYSCVCSPGAHAQP